MKKTWFIKYLATAIVSFAVAIIFYIVMPKIEYDSYGITISRGFPWWVPLLIPYFSLSLLGVAKIIKKYNLYCFERIDTGSAAYNTLFKLLIVLCGIVLIPILIILGFPIVCVEFYKDLMQAIEVNQKEKKKKAKASKTAQVLKTEKVKTEIKSADEKVSMLSKICGKKSASASN